MFIILYVSGFSMLCLKYRTVFRVKKPYMDMLPWIFPVFDWPC